MGIAMGLWTLVAALAVEPATAPAIAAAAPTPRLKLTESREYYALDAPSLESVVAQIQGREARAGDDGSSIARTRAELAVAYRLLPEGPGCRVSDLAVSLDVVVRLPQWEPSEAMRPALREQWDRMKAGMEIHEQGHRDIAVEAAEMLNARLHAIEPTEDAGCDALERRILRERIKAQMRHQNRDAAYDKRTRHGVTQAPKPPDAEDEAGKREGWRDLRDRGEGRDLSEKAGY